MKPAIENGRMLLLMSALLAFAPLVAIGSCDRPSDAVLGGGEASSPSASTGLAGTSWQLVRFQGGDGATLTPDDRASYTIEFGNGGQLTTRIDCNRGHGTWSSSGSSGLQFGALALTRAQCPPGSLHDQIVGQWGNVRSFAIKNGHLYLSLMADGGIYEFEPAQPRQTSR